MTDTTETGPARKGSTERCANPGCGHTKRDHSGRRDHTTKHPSIPLRPWCHACEEPCLYEPPASAAVPAADRAALRDRIAEALIRWTYRGQDPDPETGILDTVRANAYSRADAVLSVLPAPADRATEWRAAADKLDGISAQFDVDSCDCGNCTLCAWKDAARHLRRLAAAAGRVAADTPPADTCGQTRDISGNEHPPCARQTDHSEAYCRSADGNAYFLATGQPGKDTGTPGEA